MEVLKLSKKTDLVNDNILKSLISLAIPIMGTSFIQMAYNMTDMIWIGRVGSLAVAAVGTAGFFVWFGQSFILLSKTGAEIGVSQALGRKNSTDAKNVATNAIQLNIILAILYGLFLILFKSPLIGFFKLNRPEVLSMAKTYLFVVSLGMVFNFINPVLTGIFNGSGNSSVPFKINTVGLIFNMIFDPVLIFGYGPIPEMGVLGAAIATVLAQLVVTILFLREMKKENLELFKINIFQKFDKKYLSKIVKLGVPVALQNGLFSSFAMILGRIIAVHGDTAVAVQKVGSQIEAISWMTAGGFSTALSAFVGQNYGAGKPDRIFKGYFISIGVISVVGIFATALLIFASRPIFSYFIPEEEAIKMGVVYLKILGVSQLFMCLEITTAGAFNGFGKTALPAITSIVFTGLRVPAAMILSKPDMLGLDGVWWSISISSIIKGVLLPTLFMLLIANNKKFRASLIEDSLNSGRSA